jgi:hypothetical protein
LPRSRWHRRDISGDRYRRSENRADDLAHRGVEAARCVHAQNDETRLVGARGGKLARDVIGEWRADGAVDLKHNGTVGSRGRRRRQRKRRDGHRHQHGKTYRNCAQTCHVIRYSITSSAIARRHGEMVRSCAHKRMVAGQSSRLEAIMSEIKIFRNRSIAAKSETGVCRFRRRF